MTRNFRPPHARVFGVIGWSAAALLCVFVCNLAKHAVVSFALPRCSQEDWLPSRKQLICRHAEPVDANGEQAPAGAEVDGTVEEARAAMEAAKLRLEAAKMRMEAAMEEEENVRMKAKAEEELVAATPVATPVESPVEAPVEVLESSETAAGPDAIALINSTVVQQAAQILVKLRQAEGGTHALEALVLRACSELEAGKNCNWDYLLGDGSEWRAAGVEPAEANETLSNLAALLMPRDSPVKEVQTMSQPSDRRTALRLLIYDQLPETSRELAKLVETREGDAPTAELTFSTDSEFIVGDEEREAVHFNQRLELINSEPERQRTRLQRFSNMPLAKEVISTASKDPSLKELAGILDAHALRLYGAVREAQLRARPEEDTETITVIDLSISLEQLLGALFLVVVVAYLCFQGPQTGIEQSTRNVDQMPIYSLRADGYQAKR